MKLSELTIQAQSIEQMLIESGGEITPELEALITINTKELSSKIDGYDHIIDRLNYSVDFLKKKEDEITVARRSIENYISTLKDRIKLAMQEMNVDKIEGDSMYFKLSPSKSSLEITNEDKLDINYFEIKQVLNKEAIRKDLENGIEIEGAKLKNNFSLKRYIKKG